MELTGLKKKVHDFWTEQPCGSSTSDAEAGSRRFFDEVEEFRYRDEPEIFSFAQFSRFKEKKVLEVGVGQGTDFVQWVRSGADATGVDLTEAAIDIVKRRLSCYGLPAADLRVADCEHLPFPDGSFDLVYSWGVIMHTPNTARALDEIVRVLRPGGIGKIMVYNRRSLGTIYLWIKHALLRLRPWRSFSWCIFHHQESEGTKAFTRTEVEAMLRRRGVSLQRMETILTGFDSLRDSKKPLVRLFGRIAGLLLGRRSRGWHLVFEFQKP